MNRLVMLFALVASMFLIYSASAYAFFDENIFSASNFDDLSYTYLPHNQAAFFAEKALVKQLAINLDRANIELIEPSISKLVSLETLYIIKYLNKEPDKSERLGLSLPTEPFELPRLKRLIIVGRLDLRLNQPDRHFNSHLQELHLMHGNDDRIKFLSRLDGLSTLTLYAGWYKQLPHGIEKLGNLRELNLVGNQVATSLDDRFCQLRSLENLNMLNSVLSLYPDCLRNLNSLQTVTVTSYGDTLTPEAKRHFFLEHFKSLPGLKTLKIVTYGQGSLALSHREQWFPSLMHLEFLTYKGDYAYYGLSALNVDIITDDAWDLNPDLLAEYSKLETVKIANENILFSGQIKFDESVERRSQIDPKQGVIRLQHQLAKDYKAGRLPTLKSVEIWNRLDGEYNTIPIWKRPSGKKGNGIVPLPKSSEWEPIEKKGEATEQQQRDNAATHQGQDGQAAQ